MHIYWYNFELHLNHIYFYIHRKIVSVTRTTNLVLKVKMTKVTFTISYLQANVL